jgi:5-methylcytosine-specific restriction endonuclease McrA
MVKKKIKRNPDKCKACASVNWRLGENRFNQPKCYVKKRCGKKRAYYRKHEEYKAKLRAGHRYLKFLDNHCLLCNSIIDLEVHHIIPQSRGGTDDWSNLVTLCSICHRIITTYYRRIGWDRNHIEQVKEDITKLYE